MEDNKGTQFHKNIIPELKLFLSVKELKYKNRKEAANAVASYFRSLSPKTAAEYNNFYKTCDDYLYENAYCNYENSCVQRTKKILKIFKAEGVKKILEIGAGIGTYALAFESEGLDVDITEGKDLAFDFLMWRFKRHDSKIRIIKEIEKKYDCIYFLDVIEHVFNPFEFLKHVAKYTDRIVFTHGFKIHRQDMGGYPQHFDYNINEIKKFLQKLGFVKQKVNCVFPPHYYKRENNEK